MSKFVDNDISAFDFDPKPRKLDFVALSRADKQEAVEQWAAMTAEQKLRAVYNFQIEATSIWYEYANRANIDMDAEALVNTTDSFLQAAFVAVK